MRLLSCLLAVAGAVYGVSGCREEEKPVLFCGAGIRPPVAELVELFAEEDGVQIETDYAGSEVLLSRIKLSRKGDLYMPGDKHYIELADAEGLILSHKAACYFVPTILVQKGNPKRIVGLKDLLRPDVKWGLGDARTCAIGRKSRKILEKNAIDPAKVERNLAFQSATVNELGLQIQAKSLDAVILWDAVAKYFSEYGDEIPIPLDQNIISTVEVGVLKSTQHKKLAERFVEFVTSERGRAVFAKHHYRVDFPESSRKHQTDGTK